MKRTLWILLVLTSSAFGSLVLGMEGPSWDDLQECLDQSLPVDSVEEFPSWLEEPQAFRVVARFVPEALAPFSLMATVHYNRPFSIKVRRLELADGLGEWLGKRIHFEEEDSWKDRCRDIPVREEILSSSEEARLTEILLEVENLKSGIGRTGDSGGASHREILVSRRGLSESYEHRTTGQSQQLGAEPVDSLDEWFRVLEELLSAMQ